MHVAAAAKASIRMYLRMKYFRKALASCTTAVVLWRTALAEKQNRPPYKKINPYVLYKAKQDRPFLSAKPGWRSRNFYVEQQKKSSHTKKNNKM